jgi:hypothetical protein
MKKYATKKSAVVANKNQNTTLNACTFSFKLGVKKRLLKKSCLFIAGKLKAKGTKYHSSLHLPLCGVSLAPCRLRKNSKSLNDYFQN